MPLLVNSFLKIFFRFRKNIIDFSLSIFPQCNFKIPFTEIKTFIFTRKNIFSNVISAKKIKKFASTTFHMANFVI